MPKVGEVTAGDGRVRGVVQSSPQGIQGPPCPDEIAVNLFDLDRLVGPVQSTTICRLDPSAAFKVSEDRPDERGVKFSCSTLAAACLLDVIRSHDRRVGDYPTRVYTRKPLQKWVKAPGHAILVLQGSDGVLRLNPEFFTDTALTVRISASSGGVALARPKSVTVV